MHTNAHQNTEQRHLSRPNTRAKHDARVLSHAWTQYVTHIIYHMYDIVMCERVMSSTWIHHVWYSYVRHSHVTHIKIAIIRPRLNAEHGWVTSRVVKWNESRHTYVHYNTTHKSASSQRYDYEQVNTDHRWVMSHICHMDFVTSHICILQQHRQECIISQVWLRQTSECRARTSHVAHSNMERVKSHTNANCIDTVKTAPSHKFNYIKQANADHGYRVATNSRLLKITGLFCKRAL